MKKSIFIVNWPHLNILQKQYKKYTWLPYYMDCFCVLYASIYIYMYNHGRYIILLCL